MPSPSSTVRSTVTVSIGGADAVKGRRGSMERNAAATRPRRTIGSATQLSVRSAIAHLEEAHPAELDELRLMSMEHVQAWFVVGERELQYSALPLTLPYGVYRAQGRRECLAGIIIVEEISCQGPEIYPVEIGKLYQGKERWGI